MFFFSLILYLRGLQIIIIACLKKRNYTLTFKGFKCLKYLCFSKITVWYAFLLLHCKNASNPNLFGHLGSYTKDVFSQPYFIAQEINKFVNHNTHNTSCICVRNVFQIYCTISLFYRPNILFSMHNSILDKPNLAFPI